MLVRALEAFQRIVRPACISVELCLPEPDVRQRNAVVVVGFVFGAFGGESK